MDNSKLSDRLVAYRKNKGLTQKELADLVNYSDKVISKWERGESIPNLDALIELSKVYNVLLDELVSNKGEKAKLKVHVQQLEVKEIKGPSTILKLSIFIPVVALVPAFFIQIEVFLLSIIFLILYFIFYTIIITRVTFETEFEGNTIRVVNNPRKLGLYIDDTLVDVNTAVFAISSKLSGSLGDRTIKVAVSFNFFVKCSIFVE